MKEKVNHYEKNYDGLVRDIRNPGVLHGTTDKISSVLFKNTIFKNFSNGNSSYLTNVLIY